MRLKVVGPFVVYLAAFALWFSAWKQAPHSAAAQILGSVLGAMTLIMCGVAVLGRITPFFLFLAEFYDTFIRREPTESTPALAPTPNPIASEDQPKLVVTKKLKDGTPIRGACPICECEFSTEAFDEDPTYPHEQKLEQYYAEHFAYHTEESS